MRKTPTVFLLLIIVSFMSIEILTDCFANEVSGRHVDSRYFNIFVEDGVNSSKVALALQVPPSLKAIVDRPVSSSNSMKLAEQLDLIYLVVATTIDMKSDNFSCDIRVYRNSERLKQIARDKYAARIPDNIPGFYVDQDNAIYLDAENADLNVLGHELAHAIQHNYFLVPPPEVVQEMISGYVEYQLRKYTTNMP